ncbi:MAG: hypothetical protein AAGF04_04135 [Chlamydiota bacterium]
MFDLPVRALSRDTLACVMRLIDPEDFLECFWRVHTLPYIATVLGSGHNRCDGVLV